MRTERFRQITDDLNSIHPEFARLWDDPTYHAKTPEHHDNMAAFCAVLVCFVLFMAVVMPWVLR